jgi:hypothetical protein
MQEVALGSEERVHERDTIVQIAIQVNVILLQLSEILLEEKDHTTSTYRPIASLPNLPTMSSCFPIPMKVLSECWTWGKSGGASP